MAERQANVDRDFWRAINLAASRTKGLPSWTSGGIVMSENFEGPKQDDRLMAPFRVDISRVRVSIMPYEPCEGSWLATVRTTRLTEHVATSVFPETAMQRALDKAGIGFAPYLQPHPWKRADGSHIKAEWEE